MVKNEVMSELSTFAVALFLSTLVFQSDADCKASYAFKRLYKTHIDATLSGGGFVASFTARDQEDCENKCFLTEKDNCYKFNYNNGTRLCGLMNRGVTGSYRILESQNSIVRIRKCRGRDCYKSTQCFLLGHSNTICQCPPPLNITLCTSDGWLKVNNHSVCFGAKDNSFGRVKIPFDGKITGLKLKYLSGGTKTVASEAKGYWGTAGGRVHQIETVVTDEANNTITPPVGYTFHPGNKTYGITDYTNVSPEIPLPEFKLWVKNQNVRELAVWIIEDLRNVGEDDNSGETCTDVYLKYEY